MKTEIIRYVLLQFVYEKDKGDEKDFPDFCMTHQNEPFISSSYNEVKDFLEDQIESFICLSPNPEDVSIWRSNEVQDKVILQDEFHLVKYVIKKINVGVDVQ